MGSYGNALVLPISHTLQIPQQEVIPSLLLLLSPWFNFSSSLWEPLPCVSIGWMMFFWVFFSLDDYKCRRWSGACAVCINVVYKNILCWGWSNVPPCLSASRYYRVLCWLGKVSVGMLLLAEKCSWEKHTVLRQAALRLITLEWNYIYSLLQSSCDPLLCSSDTELAFFFFLSLSCLFLTFNTL